MVRRASGVGSTHMSELDETLDELYATGCSENNAKMEECNAKK